MIENRVLIEGSGHKYVVGYQIFGQVPPPPPHETYTLPELGSKTCRTSCNVLIFLRVLISAIIITQYCFLVGEHVAYLWIMLCSSRTCYYGVFDGHAGPRAAQFAADNLHKNIILKFPKG